MDTPTKLQFRRLPPEAQRAAFWRMAWRGTSIEQMAERTGWSVDDVRRMIDEEMVDVRIPERFARRANPAVAAHAVQ
jgi:hypothetical protein